LPWRAASCTGTSWTWCGWRCTELFTSSEPAAFAWQLDPLLLGPLLAFGCAYGVGFWRLRRRRRLGHAGRARTALWAAGYLTLLVALITPLHSLGERLFSVHMVQHLLLTLVAAPLLLLSNAMPVVLWGLPSEERSTVGRLLGRPGPVRSVLRWLTLPLVAWWLFVGTQWLWHQPGAYQWALESTWAHYAEHLTFFATAVLFWWPVIGAAPLHSAFSYPARMLYVFLAWVPNSILGAGITLSRGLLYPYYAAPAAGLGVDPHVDQQLAGLIMWVPGDALFVTILMLLFVAYLRQEERRAERLDRELDAALGTQR
jgi:putative membrane protein